VIKRKNPVVPCAPGSRGLSGHRIKPVRRSSERPTKLSAQSAPRRAKRHTLRMGLAAPFPCGFAHPAQHRESLGNKGTALAGPNRDVMRVPARPTTPRAKRHAPAARNGTRSAWASPRHSPAALRIPHNAGNRTVTRGRIQPGRTQRIVSHPRGPQHYTRSATPPPRGTAHPPRGLRLARPGTIPGIQIVRHLFRAGHNTTREAPSPAARNGTNLRVGPGGLRLFPTPGLPDLIGLK
jgi:hypothetical protein